MRFCLCGLLLTFAMRLFNWPTAQRSLQQTVNDLHLDSRVFSTQQGWAQGLERFSHADAWALGGVALLLCTITVPYLALAPRLFRRREWSVLVFVFGQLLIYLFVIFLWRG